MQKNVLYIFFVNFETSRYFGIVFTIFFPYFIDKLHNPMFLQNISHAISQHKTRDKFPFFPVLLQNIVQKIAIFAENSFFICLKKGICLCIYPFSDYCCSGFFLNFLNKFAKNPFSSASCVPPSDINSIYLPVPIATQLTASSTTVA